MTESGETDRVEAAGEARRAMWSTVGTVDDFVVSHLINPAFMGGPRWPALRQAFLTVTLPDGLTLIASDGLSDPWDDETEPNVGLGVEVYWIAPLADVPVADLARHWQFSALYQLAQNIVFNGSPVDALGKYGAISMTISPTEAAPEDWYASPQDVEMGSVFGMTLAGVPREVQLPGGPVQLAGSAPLRPDELDAVLGPDGQELRRRIAAALEALPLAQLASPNRPSVLPV
jgi:hypothetical protein